MGRMALVRGVMAASISVSSMFIVSLRMSTKTGTPPRRTKALADDTKVKDGMMISSPGPISQRMAAISRAAVQECVRRAFPQPRVFSNHSWHLRVYGPLPERCPPRTAWAM